MKLRGQCLGPEALARRRGAGAAKSLRLLLLTATFVTTSRAQDLQPAAAGNQKLVNYIHGSWDRLARSTEDCASVVDPKITAAPLLYLPFAAEQPAAVRALVTNCHVRVVHLPRTITHLGDVKPSELPSEGLLYLPHRYVVPGGRFNEMYGWDSYFILLGLLDSGKDELARGMVENFFYEIENYGALLNANRTYFLTRSQPPFLSSMIREVYEHPGSTGAAPLTKDWLAHAYVMAERDHALWTSSAHAVGKTGLARYYDIGSGPVPEMADDSTYYPDVIRWLLAHPDDANDYLLNASDHPDARETKELAQSSCDLRLSAVCAHAVVGGHRLTAAFYSGDRAMRESGFDTSFRFGPFSGSTEDYAPVCLNSLLFKYETDLAHFATLLGRSAEAAHWTAIAEARHRAINRYLWDENAGLFFDWNERKHKRSDYEYLTAFYPLWAGLATTEQARALERHLPEFEHGGGLAMSTAASGTQWDMPFGWAPTNWLAIAGLDRYGFHGDARRIAAEFSSTVADNFGHDGTVREKYNVVSGSANIAVAAGYRANVIGFGWTNGVYLRMQNLLQAAADGSGQTAKFSP